MDRIERIDARTEGPGWVLPVAASRRSERRDRYERREREPRRQPPRKPGSGPDEATPAGDGHVDVIA